jgi:ABC-2 type transport system permease protein
MTLETPRGQFQPDRPPPRIARANMVGLRDMLEYWGVKVHEDLVMDRQNTRVVLPVGQGRRIITNYPAFPIVTNMSKESPITRDLQAVIPVFPSSVELTKAVKEGKGPVKGEVLARSSQASWRQKGFFLFDPTRQPAPTKELGPFDLAVYLQGSFKSFYAGKKIPEPGPAGPPTEKAEAKPSGKGPKSPKGARLVVVADSDFIKDQYLGLNPANLMLLLNMVDYMVQDISLIAIRGKTQTRRPLETVDEGTITLAKYGNIIGLPAAVIVLGLVGWRWRRGARRRRAEQLLKD